MGGSSSSKSEAKKTITTTTTSTMRDVGLTGQNAVAMADVLETGSVKRDMVTAQLVDKINSRASKNYSQLLGGAGELLETVGDVSRQMLSAGETSQQRQIAAGADVMSYQADAGGVVERTPDWVPLAAVAVGLVSVAALARKG